MSENGSHSLNIVSQRPLKAKVRYLVGDKTTTTTFPPGSLERMVSRHFHASLSNLTESVQDKML